MRALSLVNRDLVLFVWWLVVIQVRVDEEAVKDVCAQCFRVVQLS